jgi:hypothetical protein
MSLDLRDLKLESSGDDVRLLHSELLTLGLQVPETERLRAIFGQGTHDALTEFQKQHGLNTTGVVDATTAALLDEQIKLQAPYLVGGRVYAQRAGVASLTIHLVDKNAGPDVPLGSGWTDTRGAYSIRYSPARLKAAGKSAPDIGAAGRASPGIGVGVAARGVRQPVARHHFAFPRPAGGASGDRHAHGRHLHRE